MGVNATDLNECYLARQRHLDALEQARLFLELAEDYLCGEGCAWELLAEELRQAQRVLGTITGAVSTEDLLASIFATFCIGK